MVLWRIHASQKKKILKSSLNKGVFATLYLAGLASPTGPGLGRPAPSGATALVCACVPSEPGSGEAMFVIEEAARLRG